MREGRFSGCRTAVGWGTRLTDDSGACGSGAMEEDSGGGGDDGGKT
jgi:hypothetical protein